MFKYYKCCIIIILKHIEINILNNEKIKLTFNIANKTEIHISSCCTSFVNLVFTLPIKIDDLLKKRSELIAFAKEINHPISYKHKTKSTIEKNRDIYEEEYVAYEFLYSNLLEKCQNKIKKGIFVGYGSDKELQAIFDIRNTLGNFFSRSQPLGVIQDINNKIENYKKNIKEHSKLYL